MIFSKLQRCSGLLVFALIAGMSLPIAIADESPAQAPSLANLPATNPGEPRVGWDFSDFDMIPAQNGGRLKPLDTLARETVTYLTGRSSFNGWKASDLLLSWLTAPTEWDSRRFIRVGMKDVRRELGLEENREFFSPKELIQDSYLSQY